MRRTPSVDEKQSSTHPTRTHRGGPHTARWVGKVPGALGGATAVVCLVGLPAGHAAAAVPTALSLPALSLPALSLPALSRPGTMVTPPTPRAALADAAADLSEEPLAPRPGYHATVGPTITIVSISPQSATYGVGIVVTARFSHPVPWADRQAVIKQLKVKSSRKLGAAGWAWVDAQTAKFRPKEFWPADAKVTVTARASYVPVGLVTDEAGEQQALRWAGEAKRSFRVGRSQIIRVNGVTDQASVVRSGAVIRYMGVSLGQPGWETRSGTKVLQERYYVKRMTNTSIGAAEPYQLDVPYAIRITDSGEFVHAAPWATGRIGRYNGSHGCTNLLTADARWLYSNYLYGDPIITTGTNRWMTWNNGMGGVWNVPWSVWKTGRVSA
ncbi:MAG: L,D-transpeptidase [Candidatus Nanopelagicales bacterium]